MQTIILHHYPTSPFAEKIRLIMGVKRLHWSSVLIPMVMPKPDVVALTGGYRKTPILQLGADIYCYTALIAEVLEALSPQPTLYPAQTAAASRTSTARALSSMRTPSRSRTARRCASGTPSSQRAQLPLGCQPSRSRASASSTRPPRCSLRMSRKRSSSWAAPCRSRPEYALDAHMPRSRLLDREG